MILNFLEKLGVEPEHLLIIIIIATLIIWLYKQISNHMSKHLEKEIIQIENTLASYKSLYKACLKFKDGEITKEGMLQYLIDSMRYTEKKLFLSLEDVVVNNQSLDSCMAKIREKMFYLKETIEIYYPLDDKRKLSGRVLVKVRLFENIFSPVLFTFFTFVALMAITFVSILPMFGLFNQYIISLIIMFLVLYLSTLVLTIVEKKFNHSKGSYLMISFFIITIALLIWINNIYVLVIAAFGSFVFIVLSFKYLIKK